MAITGSLASASVWLDYFGARYFSASLGRFTGPDETLFDQQPSSPQSWNLYSYVRNNPLRFLDPTGNACVVNDDGSRHDDDSGGQTCAEVDADPVGGALTIEENLRYGGGNVFDSKGQYLLAYPPTVAQTAIRTADDELSDLIPSKGALKFSAIVGSTVFTMAKISG